MALTSKGAIPASCTGSFIAAWVLIASSASAAKPVPVPAVQPAPVPPAPAAMPTPAPAAKPTVVPQAHADAAPNTLPDASTTERTSPPSGKRDPGRVRLELAGTFLQATDPHEGHDTRGGVFASIGIRPLAALEVSAKYQGSLGSWSYLTTQPSVTGATNATFATTERIHRGDLGVRFDVLRSTKLPLRLEPYLGGIFYGIDSAVLPSRFIGCGGGIGLAYEPDPLFGVELAGATYAGADLGNNSKSAYGVPNSVWNWSGGISVGVTPSSRFSIRYIGELLNREHTARLSNGVLLGFDLSFGSALPKPNRTATPSARALAPTTLF